ncbi:MAG: two-component sensor histidine kinase [Rhizobacter sp.]|nr:two-component sensor histidine kinase [Rhizobacter sp.]
MARAAAGVSRLLPAAKALKQGNMREMKPGVVAVGTDNKPIDAGSSASSASRRPRISSVSRIASGSREHLERWAIVAATIVTYLLASRFELHERLSGLLARFERFQADELVLSFVVLSLGLAIYASRRRADVRHALSARALAQAEAQALLEQNQELSRRLINAHESERRALARDLHDDLGQSCTMIRLELANILSAEDGAASRAAAVRADHTAEQLFQLAGNLLRRLRPPNLDSLGLVGAIEQLCEDWELRSGIECLFFHDLASAALSDETSVAVYRVAQEGLSNVMRHSGATRVQLRLSLQPPSCVHLSLSDDGRGMATQAANRHGLGLVGAMERAAGAGGRLDVGASKEGGTTLSLRLPLAGGPVTGAVDSSGRYPAGRDSGRNDTGTHP